ncbi:MAG: MBOAT family protein [Clostridiales bacterium]|nr:MBOAT family protein [Clostridiales bacterium]
MLFNSVDFLLFFPIALIVYYIIPKRVRYIWLLACSYYFYMGWNPAYAVLLFASTLVTYICGRILEIIKNKEWDERKRIVHKKFWLSVSLIINLGILGYFKYSGLIVRVIYAVARRFGASVSTPEVNILLPVGISFYIFQALGYTIDVYRAEIYAEKNFLRYALFVSFFPQLVAGPIERSKNLLAQLNVLQKFKLENIISGFVLIIYGLFLKMVIADRVAIIVNTVYGDWETYPGFYIVIATAFFAIQIYCDFYGYSTIARGAALTMGITLVDNFNAPYYSKSVKEFWRRWHISLSGWFRDYVYIPLGGNRKGHIRKNFNLIITFLLSGLWHGAGISYVTWGFLNGLYQVIADVRDTLLQLIITRLGIKEFKAKDTITNRILSRLITFSLVCSTWLFFRASGAREALHMIKSVLSSRNWWIFFDESIFSLGVDLQYFRVMMAAIIVLFIIDYYKYKGKNIIESFFSQNIVIQAVAVGCLIAIIIMFGCYGEMYDASEFIYFQF